MRHFRCAALAAVAVIGFSPVASAADLPVKAPVYKAPVAAPAYNWTGCYVGGNVGVTRGSSDFTTTLLPGPAGSEHLGNNSRGVVNAAISPSSADDTAFIGGGQTGCNWQGGVLVVGLEGDFSFSNLEPSRTVSGDAGSFTFTNTNSIKMDWLATIRPRVGVAFDRTLLYVTGGLAVAHLKYTQTFTDTLPDTTGGSSASPTRTGWTVGGGIEYALTNNWSAKAEYLYVKFKSVDSFGQISTHAIGPFTNPIQSSGDLSEQIVRAGFNYKFY